MKLGDIFKGRIIGDGGNHKSVSLVEAEEILLYEGHFKSASQDVIIPKLKRFWPNNKIQIRDEHGGLTCRLLGKIDLDKVNEKIKPYGWFVSRQLNDITIIEPRFDIELELKRIPQILYHITRKDVVDKIPKIGISPKANVSKPASELIHPERVYFTTSLNDVKSLAHSILQKNLRMNSIGDLVILKIHVNKLNHGIRFFIDRSLTNITQSDYEISGIYTLSNIPPTAIELI